MRILERAEPFVLELSMGLPPLTIGRSRAAFEPAPDDRLCLTTATAGRTWRRACPWSLTRTGSCLRRFSL